MPNILGEGAAEGMPDVQAAIDRVKYHAQGVKLAMMEIDPTVTEWWQGEPADDEQAIRFTLIGSRKEDAK